MDSNGFKADQKYILNCLIQSGHEYEAVISNSEENISTTVKETYLNNLDKYDALIAHIGNFDAVDLLKKNPRLKIIRLSNHASDIELKIINSTTLAANNIDPKRIQVKAYSVGLNILEDLKKME